ncbi:MAG: sensor histidine kinase [Anaerolineae bacterium]|uniref:sensor histidine kinase n=1 Tax=Candidatus Amarolinea dominans TaxID=3140696 RepID=UPI003136BA03|nr:sensor histidine kinase [Anaerolineae bacterium]
MIEFIRTFFRANQIIILSIYGQVFFVLGLAIALQSWRHSRLRLARSLNWLAAFGITHALVEWGDVFIPIQAGYLSAPIVELLHSVHVILLAFSFVCLFQFGAEALRPLPGRRRWLRAVPAIAFGLWLLWNWGPGPLLTPDIRSWFNLANILARYGIGFPAALLAAFGLWRQSRDMEANLHMPHLQRTLRLAALALVGYSVFGGLVTPRADFLLAAWLNTERMEQLLIVPVPLVRSLLGLILTVSIIRSLEVFRVELDRRLSSMEEEQVLTTERERIGRELHDGTLQTIYAAGLLLQAVEPEVTLHDGAPTAAHLQQSMQLLNQAIADIRSYIGALRSQPTGVSLAAALHDLAGHHHLRSLGDLEVKLDLPDEPPLAPVHLGHLLAIVNEALSNVARHAQATRVQLSAAVVEQQLHLQISDNGHGLSPDYVVGYGLRNMQDRARLLGGSMQIESHGKGMTIRVTVPWDEQTR